MKKLMLLAITLLMAVPGLQARCEECYLAKSKVTKKAVNDRNARKCHCHGRKCRCKGGPVKRTLKATGNVVKSTGELIAAPFEALFGDDDNRSKKKDRS